MGGGNHEGENYMGTCYNLEGIVVNLGMPNPFFNALISSKGTWDLFGKSNSHLLRKRLFQLFFAKNLSSESQLMVTFFCSLMKNKRRILSGMDGLEDVFKNLLGFKEARDFIETSMVEFPEEEVTGMFACIHLASCIPSLAFYYMCLVAQESDLNLDWACKQAVFGQMNISNSLQTVHKGEMKTFWEDVVRSTRHKAKLAEWETRVVEKKKFDEQIYENQERDKYLLMNSMAKTVHPADSSIGYTKREVEEVLQTYTMAWLRANSVTKKKGGAAGGASSSAATAGSAAGTGATRGSTR